MLKFSAPITEKIRKRKILAKKVMPEHAPQVIYFATLTTPDETSGWKSGKKSLNCNFFSLFLSKKNAFLGWFFGTRLDELLDFARKTRKFILQVQKNIENKKIQEKFRSPKCSSGSVDCWSENPDELSGRDFRFFYPAFLFCIFSGVKASSGCFFWTSRLQFGPFLLNSRQKKGFRKILM